MLPGIVPNVIEPGPQLLELVRYFADVEKSTEEETIDVPTVLGPGHFVFVRRNIQDHEVNKTELPMNDSRDYDSDGVGDDNGASSSSSDEISDTKMGEPKVEEPLEVDKVVECLEEEAIEDTEKDGLKEDSLDDDKMDDNIEVAEALASLELAPHARANLLEWWEDQGSIPSHLDSDYVVASSSSDSSVVSTNDSDDNDVASVDTPLPEGISFE
jgi:hypothetical protein